MEINKYLTAIKNKQFKPVYFIHGEEDYFIDVLTDAFENSVLTDAQKGFDQTVLYGKDADLTTIINTAKRYPMMSDYQVVIIKEAQNLDWRDEQEQLLMHYLEHLTPTTLLVFAYKHKKFDKRKKVYKLLEAKGEVISSDKVKDYKIADWISSYVQQKKVKIDVQASALIAEYLGNNLSKIVNEVDKMLLNIPSGQPVTNSDIEKNIGISKDYNVFELNSAFAKRNAFKAFQIVDYFAANPKNNPLIVIVANIGAYFTKVLKYHYLPDKSKAAAELGVIPFYLKEYEMAARNYSKGKTFHILHLIKEADLKTKGVGVTSNNEDIDLLRELVFKILN